MSIFNRTSLMESVDDVNVEPYNGYIEPTMESVAEINAELNEGVYKLNSSLYVADLLLEQRAQAGEDVKALTEAAVGDFFGKMAKKFKEIWGKIKTFFRNILKKVEELIFGGKRFINKHEKTIRDLANNKDAKWIEYDMRHYAGSAPDTSYSIIEIFRVTIMKYVTKPTFSTDEMKLDIANMEATICKHVNAKTFAEAKENIKKQAKGEKTGEKKTLTKEDLLNRLDYVKKYTGDMRAQVQKNAKMLDDICKAALSSVKFYERTINKDDNDAGTMEVVSTYCTETNKIISFGHWLSAHYTTLYSTSYKHGISVLKAFMSANSSLIKGSGSPSESKDTNEEDVQKESSDSLLESILEAF